MKVPASLFTQRKIYSYGFVFVAAIWVLIHATIVWGIEIDDSLPQDTPAAVKDSVRQAINSGLEKDDVVNFTRTMIQKGFEPQQIQLAHTLLVEAKSIDIPVRQVMNKAYEGMAKNVDPALIVKAMQAVHARNAFAFQHATRLSRNKAQAAVLGQSLASSLAAGLSQNDADQITKMIGQRNRSMKSDDASELALECFQTTRDISRLGVPSRTVTGLVGSALSQGFNGKNMRAMRTAFLAEARQSNPRELARSFSLAIQAGKGFEQVAGSRSGGGQGAGGSGSGASGSGGHDGEAGSGGSSGGAGGSGDSGGSAGGGPGSGNGGPGPGGGDAGGN